MRWRGHFPVPPTGLVLTPAITDAQGRIYFAAGTHWSNPPASGEFAEVIALNPDGTLYWRLPISHSPDRGSGLALAADGTLYVTGFFNAGMDVLFGIK